MQIFVMSDLRQTNKLESSKQKSLPIAQKNTTLMQPSHLFISQAP
jgi:hypothetical protein